MLPSNALDDAIATDVETGSIVCASAGEALLPCVAVPLYVAVNAVLLDVFVTDKRGNHILGLAKDDFAVKEDGVVARFALTVLFLMLARIQEGSC